MDPKIVEQVSSEIAKNLNGITDSVVNISKNALEQYVHAQYVFGFILLGMSLLCVLVIVLSAKSLAKNGDKNESLCVFNCVCIFVCSLAFFITTVAGLSDLYHAMTPITVLVLGK